MVKDYVTDLTVVSDNCNTQFMSV